MTPVTWLLLQAFVSTLLAELPTESVTSGAVFILLDAIARNWPIVAALVAFIWYGGKFVKTVESLAASVRSNKAETEKVLIAHGEKLDEHGESIARIDQSTTILLNHTGLTAP